MSETGSEGAGQPGPQDRSAELRGRRIASRVFLGFVGAWTALAAGQICVQVLLPAVTPSPYPTCAAGLGALHAAVTRARESSGVPSSSNAAPLGLGSVGSGDAEEALGRYRAALEPEWGRLEGIRQSCPGEVERRGLDALERLRYAEEHAVRREASSLAPLRHQVARTIEGLTREPPERDPRDATSPGPRP